MRAILNRFGFPPGRDVRVPVSRGLDLRGLFVAVGVPARIVVFPEENRWILRAQSAAPGCTAASGRPEGRLGDEGDGNRNSDGP